MMNTIQMKKVEDIEVIGTRKTGHYTEIKEMLMSLFQHAAANDLEITGPPMFITHERSEEEAMKAQDEGNADMEAVLPVKGDSRTTPEVNRYTVPGGSMASIVHKGPYDQVGDAYRVLFDWLAQNNKELKGPMRELYPNDPSEVPPGEILTEIQAPIG